MQKLLEEDPDVLDAFPDSTDDAEASSAEDAAAEESPSPRRTCASPEWTFQPIFETTSLLQVDRGPNEHRPLSGAHVWTLRSEDVVAAAEPFAEPCVLSSASALHAVLGVAVAPPLLPPEHAHAWCYCGHQLGSFSGQLGDGAACYARVAGGAWELCWKGCGRTPFSRLGTSGRKRLGSCVRELLVSEALAALGVRCARGLAVFAARPQSASEGGGRDSGAEESGAAGALLVRACSGAGMLRFGSFDIANRPALDPRNGREGPSAGQNGLISNLVAFATGGGCTAELLHRACRGSAQLVAQWAALGFVHGTLNTDNVHVAGLAIDLASGRFMSIFDPDDDADGPPAARGRYSYRRQAAAMFWNLQRLAASLVHTEQLAQEAAAAIVARFPGQYHAAWLRAMRRKLGLTAPVAQVDAERRLVERLLGTMEATFADFTASFRSLSPPPENGEALLARLEAWGPAPAPALRAELLERRAARLRPGEPRELLQHLAERSAEERLQLRLQRRLAGHEAADRLLQAAALLREADAAELRRTDAARWTAWLAEYRALCPRPDAGTMARANPKFVPRPDALDDAVAAAESGDFSRAQRLVDSFQDMFSD